MRLSFKFWFETQKSFEDEKEMMESRQFLSFVYWLKNWFLYVGRPEISSFQIYFKNINPRALKMTLKPLCSLIL